jgi:hypothetical protein
MMGRLKLRVFAAAGLLTLSLAGSASAAPIGPNCGSCFNTIWDLTATPVDAANGIYHLDFTATGTADTQSTYDFINGVAFKVVPNASFIQAASLVSSPGGSWDLLGGPLGGPTQCQTLALSSAWLCAEATDQGVASPGDGDTLLWRFLVDLNTVLTDGQDVSIQATMTRKFTGGGGPFVGQQVFSGELSEGLDLTITVPEPQLLALMGFGFLIAARQIRRVRRVRQTS